MDQSWAETEEKTFFLAALALAKFSGVVGRDQGTNVVNKPSAYSGIVESITWPDTKEVFPITIGNTERLDGDGPHA